jgi:sortase A
MALLFMSDSRWRRTEKLLFIMGITLLSLYGSARLHSEISSRLALRSFERPHVLAAPRCKDAADSPANQRVDFTLWSEKRLRAYRESLIAKKDRPLGVLRIPSLEIEVPVFDGTDDLTLNRGIGRIIGSARIGSVGNTALAGHRDGFFRALREISIGANLELVTPDRTIHYLVEQTEIVMPDDVSVLADRGEPSLTLVTCFPFYFVGDAAKRLIVHAKSTDFYGPAGECSASLSQIRTQEKIK